MGIIIIKYYIIEVEKQNKFYEKTNCAKSLYILNIISTAKKLDANDVFIYSAINAS
jgi:hypothetical protein